MRLLIFTLIVLLGLSCNKNNGVDLVLTQREVKNVQGPSIGNLNQTVPITVFWYSSSGSCDVLEKFEETKQGSIIYIKAFGYLNAGLCTMDAPIKAKTYHFTATKAGTFELRFLNRDNSFITHTVVIN